ncbi:MAG: peptidylprolyl isomerase [Chitinophagaceae bacterium]
MSVIQNIRDKYARWAVVAIALALLGFILMDAFAGGNVFGGNSTTIGKVNGKEMDYIDFEKKIKVQEDMYRQQGYDMGDAGRQQVIESVWNAEVMEVVLNEQFNELGLAVSSKEINDILFGNNPPDDLKQRFSDPNTGVYNAGEAQQFINNIKRTGRPEDKSQLNNYVISLETNRKMEKYTSLITNSIYFPKWFVEKQISDNSLINSASYVSVPYTSIADSAVKISDSEINDYIKSREKEFEQKEEMRSINYVLFNAAPSAVDSVATLTQISELKPQFESTNDAETFVAQQGTSIPYADAYFGRSKIQVPNKDSIFALSKGGVFGPYLDQTNYVLAKKIDEKIMPDSARVRHILIQTMNPQTGQPLMADSVAKNRVDSINQAIRGGASFENMVALYSDDQGSKNTGGVYEWFPQGQMVKAFNEFVFEKPVGSRDVVKTEFGYHLIEVLGQKGQEMHYKIAYLAKPVFASNETDNAASNAANQFAGNSRDLKAFNENYEKDVRGRGINKLVALDIRPGDYSISGLGNSRQLVKAIFEADKGDVLQPQRVGDQYVVTAIIDVNEAGLQSVAKARATVEPILRNRKKAEQIQKRLGTITTLEAASAATAQSIQRADSVRFVGANTSFGFEAKVIGAIFNPENSGKVIKEAIAGQSGVFVLQPGTISATPVANADVAQQRSMMQAQARQMSMYRSPVEALKNTADIKDNRSRFY